MSESDDVNKSANENSSVKEMSDTDKLIESEEAASSKIEVEESEYAPKQALHKERQSSKNKGGKKESKPRVSPKDANKRESTSQENVSKKENISKGNVSNEATTSKKDAKKSTSKQAKPQEQSMKELKDQENSLSKEGFHQESSDSKRTIESSISKGDVDKEESTSKRNLDTEELSSNEDADEDSSTESCDDKPSDENFEEMAFETSGGDPSNKESDDDDEPKPKSSGEGSETKKKEQKQKHEQFKKKLEILLKTATEGEKAEPLELWPCDSCEFLVDPKSAEVSWCCWGKVRNRCVSKKIQDFWIVSAPVDETSQETFDKANEATAPNMLSINYKLHIPKFKIGTLDQLIYMSGSLSKLEIDAGHIVKNLVDFMKTIIKDKLRKFLIDNDIDVISYITRFTWNSVRYPETKPLNILKDVIRSQVWNVEYNLKARTEELGYLDKSLENFEKENTGSLATRSLAEYVKKEDVVLGSRLYTSLMVVVPLQLEKEWKKSYNKQAEMVVPGSSKELFSDKQHKLFCVVIGRKCVDEFKENATKKGFVVRDFEYSEKEIGDEKETQKNLEDLKEKYMEVLTRWLKVKFKETFAAWIHIKVMRCFVESVLRFGIQPGFQAMVLIPMKHKSLRRTLDDLYRGIDNDLILGQISDAPAGLENIGGKIENTKYVFLTVPIQFLGKE